MENGSERWVSDLMTWLESWRKTLAIAKEAKWQTWCRNSNHWGWREFLRQCFWHFDARKMSKTLFCHFSLRCKLSQIHECAWLIYLRTKTVEWDSALQIEPPVTQLSCRTVIMAGTPDHAAMPRVTKMTDFIQFLYPFVERRPMKRVSAQQPAPDHSRLEGQAKLMATQATNGYNMSCCV